MHFKILRSVEPLGRKNRTNVRATHATLGLQHTSGGGSTPLASTPTIEPQEVGQEP